MLRVLLCLTAELRCGIIRGRLQDLLRVHGRVLKHAPLFCCDLVHRTGRRRSSGIQTLDGFCSLGVNGVQSRGKLFAQTL